MLLLHMYNNNKYLNFLLPLILLFITSACRTPQVYTHVNSLSYINAPMHKTISIVHANQDLNNSLEFNNYRSKVAWFLSHYGYSVIEETMEAQHIAVINFGVDTGINKTSSISLPVYGQTGVSGSTTQGTVNAHGGYGTFSGTTTYYPTYGIVGYNNIPQNWTEYTRIFQLDIYESFKNKDAKPIKLYESISTSKGTGPNVGCVIDDMLKSLFTNFPYNTNQQFYTDYTGSC